MITQDFIEAVSAGTKFKEVRNLSPLDTLRLGIAVKQYEEDLGVTKENTPFDNEAMAKVIIARNTPIATMETVTFFKKDNKEQN
jgi:hypothetical protein